MGNTSSKSPQVHASDLIDNSLKDNQIVIFSKLSCGYCQAVKDTLSQQTGKLARSGCTLPTPKIIELDDGTLSPQLMMAIQNELGKRTGATTVPRVFIDGDFVGGAQETVQMAQNGRLSMVLMQSANCVAK